VGDSHKEKKKGRTVAILLGMDFAQGYFQEKRGKKGLTPHEKEQREGRGSAREKGEGIPGFISPNPGKTFFAS